MTIRITGAGIAKLIDDKPANLVNRRSKGMLHLGRKEGGEFAYSLTDAVQMVIIANLTGFVSMADAHHIGEDPELRFVLENLDNGTFGELDQIILTVTRPGPTSRKDGEERADSFLFAGRAKETPAFNWRGSIQRSDGNEINLGLKRHKTDLTNLLSPIRLTFDLRNLERDVRSATLKTLPQSFG